MVEVNAIISGQHLHQMVGDGEGNNSRTDRKPLALPSLDCAIAYCPIVIFGGQCAHKAASRHVTSKKFDTCRFEEGKKSLPNGTVLTLYMSGHEPTVIVLCRSLPSPMLPPPQAIKVQVDPLLVLTMAHAGARGLINALVLLLWSCAASFSPLCYTF